MVMLANVTDIVAITVVILICVALIAFFVIKKAKGEKIEDCDCKGKGKEMKAYYMAVKKKEEKRKKKEEKKNCCCCNTDSSASKKD